MFRASLCPSSGDRLNKAASGVSLDVLATVVCRRDTSWVHCVNVGILSSPTLMMHGHMNLKLLILFHSVVAMCVPSVFQMLGLRWIILLRPPALLCHSCGTITYILHATESFLKTIGFQLVKKFPPFYGTRKFITAFTSARHLSLSWASSIQSIPTYPPIPLPEDPWDHYSNKIYNGPIIQYTAIPKTQATHQQDRGSL